MLLTLFDLRLDQLIIYVVGLTPILGVHSKLNNSDCNTQDLFPFSQGVGDVAVVLHWIFLVLYVFRQIFLFSHTKKVNATKLIILATTWVSWYFLILCVESNIAISIQLLHSFPYLYLIFYMWKKNPSKRKEPIPLPVLVYSVLILITVLDTLTSKFGSNYPFVYQVIYPVILAYNFSHYLFDALIWRTRSTKNQEVFEVFRFSTHKVTKV